MPAQENLVARKTGSVGDIIGPENLLLLLSSPGDEVLCCGGLIAEACARGRPPFVVILNDGAADGSPDLARRRERATRASAALLGLPAERLLFVGLRPGAIPAPDHPLFPAVKAAMALLSRRHDCNVIGAPFPARTPGDDAATSALAQAIADDSGLARIACSPQGPLHGRRRQSFWALDVRPWAAAKAMALTAHGNAIADRAPAKGAPADGCPADGCHETFLRAE